STRQFGTAISKQTKRGQCEAV
ncbi:hypothetical protein A5865_001179, partial [Enterococcus sp. 12E11_DIV0728]